MRKFKVKNRVKRMNFESSNESTTFRNLLYAICNCEITDHLATQIYKNWNKVENPDTKVVNKLRNPSQLDAEQNEVPYYNELTLSANNIISNEVNNNNLERVSKNSVSPCAKSNIQSVLVNQLLSPFSPHLTSKMSGVLTTS
uniref:Uncharacterized protein n=1 Tax=Ceratitis capitata TaxID=7213 RepID=W8BI33_CERCA